MFQSWGSISSTWKYFLRYFYFAELFLFLSRIISEWINVEAVGLATTTEVVTSQDIVADSEDKKMYKST